MMSLACLLVMTGRTPAAENRERTLNSYRMPIGPLQCAGQCLMTPRLQQTAAILKEKLQALEAGVALAADDDVVMDGDTERAGL